MLQTGLNVFLSCQYPSRKMCPVPIINRRLLQKYCCKMHKNMWWHCHWLSKCVRQKLASYLPVCLWDSSLMQPLVLLKAGEHMSNKAELHICRTSINIVLLQHTTHQSINAHLQQSKHHILNPRQSFDRGNYISSHLIAPHLERLLLPW